MKTTDQLRYLNLLGIPYWRSREEASEKSRDSLKETVKIYSLTLHNKNIILWVELSSQPELYEKEQQLLKNMVRSLGIEEQNLKLDVAVNTADGILCMKKNEHEISQLLSGYKNMVYTHTLGEMLLNPKLKAAMWSCFKKLC